MGTPKKLRNKRLTPMNKIFAVCLVIVSAIVLFVICLIIAYSFQLSAKFADFDDSKVFNLSRNSSIYAADGQTVLAELQIENRQPVSSLSEISPNVTKATISTEDARFYDHHGVDLFALFRAISVIFSGGNTQGGSTITMQLTRNTILTKVAQQITLERKISEIILANRIEDMYSKDEILLMYLNTINYGDRCYGIKAASKHYFSLNPDQLNLNQAATLVGIPQAPSYLSPTNNMDACINRRNQVLYRMYDDHVITKEEYETTKAQPIELNLSYIDPTENYKYPYFTNYIREQILEKYSDAEIFEGGFQIYTTLDIKHQEACEYGCEKQNSSMSDDSESVAVTMDPKNGYITGMVGGSDYSKNQYNIATSKGRPTGSAFKMFTLATAIEQGYDPYSYTVDCSGPMSVGTVRIENYGNASYGTRTVQGATAISSNTGFVRLQQKVETQNVINMAKRLGIKNANLPNVTTLTLGVADINPVEMASAFATIANGGIYHEPVSITKIETASGELIFEYDDTENPDNNERVIDEKIAGAVTKVLQTVFTQGTATSAKLANGQPVAGKTGTSEDWRDLTLTGYTPKVVLSTWIGKRDYTPNNSSLSCNNLFKTIMDRICEGEEIVDFPKVGDPTYTKKSEKEQPKENNSDLNNTPNVVGMSLEQAKQVLSAYNLTIYYVYSDVYANGYVISQTVENDRIALRVSKGRR